MSELLLSITEAAAILGVSVDTLRRWDENGKLVAIRKEGGTHRFYTQKDLDVFSSDLLGLASNWAFDGSDIPGQFYCPNSAVFQARLTKMQDALISSGKAAKFFSLIVSTTGEIGNNSYDHNLGNWPDQPGVFFGYDINKETVVLADRGLGILQTLRKVKPSLMNHQEALLVAFTEVISGRAPEERGNGLKFVRKIISEQPTMNLFFQTGDAELRMKGGDPELRVNRGQMSIRGCLAQITF